jgi:hypothetical protein
MIRKLSALLLALVTIQLYCGLPAMATGLNGDLLLPTSQQDASEVFKSGVKFDPASHQWVDRYSGKAMQLGLPGVAEKFGGRNVISAVSTSTSNSDTTTTTTSTFPWKKFLILSALGLGIATSIAVPVACGVHHHHNNNNQNANNLAMYYYLHNQTLPVPHFVLPPAPPVFIHIKPPPR